MSPGPDNAAPRRLTCFRNPKTGMSIVPLQPGDPGYGPESNAFVRDMMALEPGDEGLVAVKRKVEELKKEWLEVKRAHCDSVAPDGG